MALRADYFLKKALGEDFESLLKTELYKPGTRSVSDIEDMRIGLKIVPRAIMALLVKELAPMQVGEHKDIKLPISENAVLRVDKVERDAYNGQIEEDNKKVAEFNNRSIPGVGLYLLSTFELYNTEDISKESKIEPGIEEKVQKIIDDRLALHDLIGKVVDKKIMEKDAVEKLVLLKLTEAMEHKEPKETPKKKGSPLKDFIESREKKKKEFSIEMKKNETVNCPDCDKEIFNENGIATCVCFGDSGKVYIKKSETGIKVSFGAGWEPENIEMLLDVLRKKNV